MLGEKVRIRYSNAFLAGGRIAFLLR
ncbi:hypothetical protein MY11210_008230 [Beauveria gryllotalpidicola]